MSDVTNSSTPAQSGKPAKPSPDFPLFPHATGRWSKKPCRGRWSRNEPRPPTDFEPGPGVTVSSWQRDREE